MKRVLFTKDDKFRRARYVLQYSVNACKRCFNRRSNDLLSALRNRAEEHKMTVRIGRSHGIHAEPTTMGLTFARFYAEMKRNKRRLEEAKNEIATGAISGAVGTLQILILS